MTALEEYLVEMSCESRPRYCALFWPVAVGLTALLFWWALRLGRKP